MADIFERLLKNQGPIGQHRERAHGYFAFPKLEGDIGSRMKFRGTEKIVWSLNNYLGLANHPEVRKAAPEQIREILSLGIAALAVTTVVLVPGLATAADNWSRVTGPQDAAVR